MCSSTSRNRRSAASTAEPDVRAEQHPLARAVVDHLLQRIGRRTAEAQPDVGVALRRGERLGPEVEQPGVAEDDLDVGVTGCECCDLEGRRVGRRAVVEQDRDAELGGGFADDLHAGVERVEPLEPWMQLGAPEPVAANRDPEIVCGTSLTRIDGRKAREPGRILRHVGGQDLVVPIGIAEQAVQGEQQRVVDPVTSLAPRDRELAIRGSGRFRRDVGVAVDDHAVTPGTR